MGTYLSTPVTAKHEQAGECLVRPAAAKTNRTTTHSTGRDNGIEHHQQQLISTSVLLPPPPLAWGVVDMQGWRKGMEDAHIAQTDVKLVGGGGAATTNDDQHQQHRHEHDAKCFAVFDGHGGPEVARFCQLYLVSVLRQQPSWRHVLYEDENNADDDLAVENTPMGLTLRSTFHALDRMIDDPGRRQEIVQLRATKPDPAERRTADSIPPHLHMHAAAAAAVAGGLGSVSAPPTPISAPPPPPPPEPTDENTDDGKVFLGLLGGAAPDDDADDDENNNDDDNSNTPTTPPPEEEVVEIEVEAEKVGTDNQSSSTPIITTTTTTDTTAASTEGAAEDGEIAAGSSTTVKDAADATSSTEAAAAPPPNGNTNSPVDTGGTDSDDDNNDTSDDDSEKAVGLEEAAEQDRDLMLDSDSDGSSSPQLQLSPKPSSAAGGESVEGTEQPSTDDAASSNRVVSSMFKRLLNLSSQTGSVVVNVGSRPFSLTGLQSQQQRGGGETSNATAAATKPGDAADNTSTTPSSPEGDAAASSSSLNPLPTIVQHGRMICNLPDHPIHAGATAIVAVMVGMTLTVANAGDSRAVLCRDGRAFPLSFDHKPLQDRELNRIKNAGGFVNQFGRVNGNLNLSRSIGDLKYKQVQGIPPAEQMITAEPDIVQLTLNPTDEFIILGCDGIWDCLTNDKAVEYVRSRIGTRTPTQIGVEMLDEIISPDPRATQGIGGDNMTIMIVDLQPETRSYRASSTSAAAAPVVTDEEAEAASSVEESA